MEAKDRVISGVREVDGTTFLPPDYISWREHHNLMKVQDKISFKAGWEAHEKIVPKHLEAHGDICYKAGIREVVEWVLEHSREGKYELLHYCPNCDHSIYGVPSYIWQAKLKEWGIEP